MGEAGGKSGGGQGQSRAEMRLLARAGEHEQRRRLLREAVLDASCEALLAQPWEALSMLEVAERAQVHRSTLYNEFGSRRRVLGALVAREAERLPAQLADELAQDAISPSLALERVFARFLTASRTNGLLAALLRGGEVEVRALAAARRGQVLLALAGSIGQAWPALHRRDCEQIAECLFCFAVSVRRMPAGSSTARNVGVLLGTFVEDRLAKRPAAPAVVSVETGDDALRDPAALTPILGHRAPRASARVWSAPNAGQRIR